MIAYTFCSHKQERVDQGIETEGSNLSGVSAKCVWDDLSRPPEDEEDSRSICIGSQPRRLSDKGVASTRGVETVRSLIKNKHPLNGPRTSESWKYSSKCSTSHQIECDVKFLAFNLLEGSSANEGAVTCDMLNNGGGRLMCSLWSHHNQCSGMEDERAGRTLTVMAAGETPTLRLCTQQFHAVSNAC